MAPESTSIPRADHPQLAGLPGAAESPGAIGATTGQRFFQTGFDADLRPRRHGPPICSSPSSTGPPQSTATQWLKGGQPVAGATAATLKATEGRQLRLSEHCTNHAGSAAQSAAGISVYKVGKTTLNKKKGTATVTVEVPGAGTAKLSGKKVAKQKRKRSAATAGKVKLLVKAKGKAKKTLAKKGKVKVKATVGFAPLAGSAASQTVKVTLKKKPSG